MKNSLVSIIVPIYNVEKYLNRCLLSIKEQTYANIEIIMVNDGSTDSSRDIANNYQKSDNRFKLLDKENGGLSSGRNYGMQYASGDYICFVDSDDFLDKNYVLKLLDGFDNEVDIVIGDYVLYDDSTGKSYYHGPQYNPGRYSNNKQKIDLINALLSGKPVMSVWKNMYRTAFLKSNNLLFTSERLVYAEDKLFHVEAYSKARTVVIIPEIVFFHLVIPGSLSQGYRRNYFEMSKELHLRILNFLKEFYDETIVSQYCMMIPSIIGSSLFHLCKCSLRESKQNIKVVLSDTFVKNAYQTKYHRTGYLRYWILYKIGSLNSSSLVVLVARLMLLSNPIYRLLQRKKEYFNDAS